MDLKEENAIAGDPREHWYYIAKGRAIKQMLGPAPIKALLDVGAGSGVFSKMLVEEARARRAVCVDPNYSPADLAASSERVAFRRDAGEIDADAVLMIDVIEHVDDDSGLIAQYAEPAAPGARFLISAPAFSFLWSSHDEFLDHRRRYTLETLERAVRAGGLEPVSSRYFFGFIFPAAAAMRLADRFSGDARAERSDLRPAPAWLAKALVSLHDLERATLFPFNKLAGVSAFCLAEKREERCAKAA